MAGSFNIAPINLYSAAGLPDPNDPTQQPAAPEQGRFGGDVVDAAQMGAARSVGGILDFVGANDMAKSFYGIADDQTNQMSTRGREAMGKKIFETGEDGGIGLGDGATDFDTWLLNFANVAGGVAATVPLGGAAGAATKLGSAVGMGFTGGSAATGMAMEEGRQEILKMDDNMLRESPKYAEVMQMVDQQFADSDMAEKHLIAKASLANMVAEEIRSDPKQLAANFAAAAIGDPIIGKALTGARIAKGGIRAGFAKGALVEGSTESLQAGTSQYGVNEALQPFDNRQLDRGVAEAALNEGLFGGAFGGAAGAASGALNRGRVADIKANDPVKVQTGNSAIDSALADLNNNVTNAQIVVEPSSPTAPAAPAGEKTAPGSDKFASGLFDMPPGYRNQKQGPARQVEGPQPSLDTPTIARRDYGTVLPSDMGAIGDNLQFTAALNQRDAPVPLANQTADLLLNDRQQVEQAAADEAAAATQAAFGDVANQFRQINTGTSPVQQALVRQPAATPASLTADTMLGARQAAADAEGEAAAQATSAAFADAARTTKMQSDRWQRRMPVPVTAAKEGEVVAPASTDLVPAGPRVNWDDVKSGRAAYLNEQDQVVIAGQDPSFNPAAPAPSAQLGNAEPAVAPEGPRGIGWNGAYEMPNESGVGVRNDGQAYPSAEAALRSPKARAAAVAEGKVVKAVPFGEGYGWVLEDKPVEAAVEEAVPEDLPVPAAPKATEKGLRATKSYKDAVKWAADKDYTVEPVQTAEGWTFTVKKPESAAAEVAAADVVAPVPQLNGKGDFLRGQSSVRDFLESNGIAEDDIDIMELARMRDDSNRTAFSNSAYGSAIRKIGDTIADELSKAESRKPSTPTERADKNRAIAKWQQASSLLASLSKKYEDPFQNNLVDKLPPLLKQRHGRLFDSVRTGDAARTEIDSVGYYSFAESLFDTAETLVTKKRNAAPVEAAANVEQEVNMELKEKIDALPDAVLQKLLNVVKPRVLPGEDPVRKLLMTDQAKVGEGLAEVMQPAAAPQGRSVGVKTRRGEVGGMMTANEVVLTSTGRETTPFPSWKRVTGSTATKVDKWLLENAAAEAEARGDKLKAKIFRGELRQKTIPQASKDEAENYLFNDEWSTIGAKQYPLFRQDAILDKPVRGMSMTLAMRAVDNQLSKLGRLGGIKVEVVPTQDQFPGMPAGMRVKGFYSPSRKTVVLIAENMANPSEVRKTLMHELLAHGGLDVVLGKEKASELMATIAATRGKPSFDAEWAVIDANYSELSDMEKAEELFARFVENAPDRGSLKYWWQSILNKLKRWMYQAGWTQNDKGFTAQDMQNALDAIVDGFRKDRTASERASVGTSDKFRVDDVMFSREPYETMATPEVDRILQKAHKGVLSKAKDLVSTSGLLDSVKSNMWAALTLGQLSEVSGKLFKNGSFKSYNETYQQYVADVQTAATEASILANEIQSWAKTDQPAAKAMFELAHDATIFGLEADPTVEFQSPLPELQQKLKDLQSDLSDAVASGQDNAAKQLRKEIKTVREEIRDYDADAEARRATLHKRFNALPREAQDHYRRMRDAYVKRRNEAYRFQKTELQKAIDDATTDGNSAAAASAKKALSRLQQEQRIARLSGPYFPLTRFGDYFLDMVNPQGERVFLMMESEMEMKRAAAEFEKEGWSIERKGKTVQFARDDGISGEILDQLGKIVDDANLDKDEADGLRDQIYQMYLQYLPNRSLRKNLIHRKGVRGFEQDAVRAFANSMSRSSTQISRMKHLPAFNRSLREANSQVREYERTGAPGEAVRSREMMEELRKRHENIMNPQESKLSQAITGLGFSWLLGLSPAAAVINLSQTATVAAPVLSSKLNMSLPKTLALLTAEMRKLRITQSSTGEKLLSLRQTLDNPDERNAYDELEKMGIIDMTRAHDLVGLSETGGFQYGGKFHKAMSFVSKFFHNAEVINREVTAMVAYRRARETGMDHKDAVKLAAELTRESHFDYSSGNRARFMQGNVAKVAFQFKQYSQQMTYYLIRNAWRSLPWKDLTAAEKRQARAQLFGTLATTGFIGGLSALPIAALYSLINALVPDDEDDAPFNAKQEFYTFLAQNFGKDLANTVIYGAGGAGLSSRIQLNELWLRDPAKNLEGAQAYTNYVMQLLGPVAGGILPNMVSGAQLIDEGEYQKGVEKMIPKAIKDWSVAERYGDEGATTLRGDVLKQDFSYLELFLQANGLADNDVTAQYEENAALKGVADTLKRRRQTLMDRFYESSVAKDYEAMGDVNEAIEKFNQKNPAIAISRKNLRQSMKSRTKRNEATTKGLYLDKNLRYLEEKIDWL